MDRIKFYSKYDMSRGHYLKNIVEILNSNRFTKNEYTINDIIEYYNIVKYFECGLLELYCNEQGEQNISVKIKELRVIIGKFLGEEKSNNILRLYEFIDIEYKEDFWELIENHKLYKSISKNDFLSFSKSEIFYLYPILKNKKTATQFGNEIKNYMLKNCFTAEWILSKYEVEHLTEGDEIYFPIELTLEDKERVLLNYIKSERSHPNYLKNIIDCQSSDELKISDKTRLAAKKRHEEEIEKLFAKNSGITSELSVKISLIQEEAVIYSYNGFNWDCSVGIQWIKNNLDYNTLLNNFIYIYDFFDKQGRLNLVSKINEVGTIEKVIGTHSKKTFRNSSLFNQKDGFSKLKMQSYYNVLLENNIRLEDIIEWFFSSYLKDEFNINDFNITLPSKASSWWEKCRAILPEIESALKQYNLYIEDGLIELELLQISSKSVLYNDCRSLLKKKYIYADSDECSRASFLFFSDQCLLHYLPNIEEKFKTFFQLMKKKKVKLNDYKEYQQADLNWLIENEYLWLNDEGFLKIKNLTKVLIYKDLYDNEVISYWRSPKEFNKEIDILLENETLTSSNRFFSKPESDYFNYHLNKTTFGNSLDLRNKYLHGTQSSNKENEDEHFMNYMIYLKLFIIIIVKMNDELCIEDEISELENEE